MMAANEKKTSFVIYETLSKLLEKQGSNRKAKHLVTPGFQEP